MEIERKSSLLASAIDRTIKSIEEYKEEVGINEPEPTNNKVEITCTTTNGSDSVVYNGYSKVVETKFYDTNATIDTDTAEPIIEMNGTSMDTKDTEVAIRDNKVAEASTLQTDVTEDKGDTLEGYRQVTFNPDDLQQVIQQHREARMAGVPVSKCTNVRYI